MEVERVRSGRSRQAQRWPCVVPTRHAYVSDGPALSFGGRARRGEASCFWRLAASSRSLHRNLNAAHRKVCSRWPHSLRWKAEAPRSSPRRGRCSSPAATSCLTPRTRGWSSRRTRASTRTSRPGPLPLLRRNRMESEGWSQCARRSSSVRAGSMLSRCRCRRTLCSCSRRGAPLCLSLPRCSAHLGASQRDARRRASRAKPLPLALAPVRTPPGRRGARCLPRPQRACAARARHRRAGRQRLLLAAAGRESLSTRWRCSEPC